MSSDLRTRVLEAAKQSFSSFGYKATTIEQIAKLAGVGKGTIYTFFESKEVLLHHITDLLIEEMLAPIHWENSYPAQEANQPHTLLIDHLQQGLEGLLHLRQRQELFVKLSQELQLYGTAEVKRELQRVEVEIVRFIAALIEQAVKRQEVPPCQPELTAFLIYKMTSALLIDWEQQHDPLDRGDIERLFQRMLTSLLTDNKTRTG